jgi:hypothetical protein
MHNSLRTRALAAAAALGLLLGAAAIAQARIYDVPSQLGTTLAKTRAKTTLAILLPQRLALDYDGRVYASGGGGSRSYDLELAGAPNCGGATACFLATFTAQRGEAPHFTRKVMLSGGRTGYFKPLSCGASCSPPAIEWRSRGNLYSIQAKVPDSTNTGALARLKRAANSALAAGPR